MNSENSLLLEVTSESSSGVIVFVILVRSIMIPYKLVQPYRKYFQKSKSFLYPALGIKRGCHITPEQTYISWGAKIRSTDKKLIVAYEGTSKEVYRQFEKNILLKHPMFSEFFMCENNRWAYTFSFDSMEDDWVENSLILITIFRLKVIIVFRSILTTHFRFELTTPERQVRSVVLAA